MKEKLRPYLQAMPDIQTGFLAFISYGNTADLNCDYIGLEIEPATEDKIHSIHKEDKKALVWTVNKKSVQRHFLCSEADAIITDNITQAAGVKEELASRSDFARMYDRVRVILASTM